LSSARLSNRNIYLTGLIVFIITAIFSSGSYHFDEHFQILEFANYKLGNVTDHDLPWEFKARIRPTLQPTVAMLVIQCLNFIGIKNPFTYAMVLRLISALLSWIVLVKLSNLLLKNFSSEKSKKIFLVLSFFLWFVPLLSVRFSSENWSAITFFAAIYFILRFVDSKTISKTSQLIFAGLLLGFSFFFRFQIGFAIMGLFGWIVFVSRIKWKHISIIVLFAIVSVALCVYIDCWFYGEFQLTPFNYFKSNIIENKAADFGTSPWWFYIVSYLNGAIPPISIFLSVLFFIGLYKNPKNIFVWSMVPFLLVHFIVGHKEMRFLFPMVFAFVYIASLGIDFLIEYPKLKFFKKPVFVITLIVNTAILIFIMFTSTQPVVKYYEFLYYASKDKEVVILSKNEDVYQLIGLPVNFYRSPNVKCKVMKNDRDIDDYLDSTKTGSVYVLERSFTKENSYKDYHTQIAYSRYPLWIIHFNFNDWMSRTRLWKILLLERN
jgi:phosphatidylinositol glycan class B